MTFAPSGLFSFSHLDVIDTCDAFCVLRFAIAFAFCRRDNLSYKTFFTTLRLITYPSKSNVWGKDSI